MQQLKSFSKNHYVALIYTAICLLTLILPYVGLAYNLPAHFSESFDQIAQQHYYRLLTTFWIHSIPQAIPDIIFMFLLGTFAEDYLGHWRYAIVFPTMGVICASSFAVLRQYLVRQYAASSNMTSWFDPTDLLTPMIASSSVHGALACILLLLTLAHRRPAQAFAFPSWLRWLILAVILIQIGLTVIAPLWPGDAYDMVDLYHLLGAGIGLLSGSLYLFWTRSHTNAVIYLRRNDAQ